MTFIAALRYEPGENAAEVVADGDETTLAASPPRPLRWQRPRCASVFI
jgi:hypothetical protein